MPDLIVFGAEDLMGLTTVAIHRMLTDVEIVKINERLIQVVFDRFSFVDLMFSTENERDSAYDAFMREKNYIKPHDDETVVNTGYAKVTFSGQTCVKYAKGPIDLFDGD